MTNVSVASRSSGGVALSSSAGIYEKGRKMAFHHRFRTHFERRNYRKFLPSAFRLRLHADTGKRCFLTFSECPVSVRFTYFFRKTVSPFFLPPAFHADSTASAKDSTHAVLLDPLYGTFLIAAVVHVVLRRQARCQGDVALHCTRWFRS